MKTSKRYAGGSRKGVVLPLVIMIGVCLAILGLGLIQLGYGSRLMAAITEAGITARAAADAGLTRAVYEMNSRFVYGSPPDITWLPYTSGVVKLDQANARYEFWIDPPFTDPATGDRYWPVRSRGTSGREVKNVYALAGLTNLFDYGLIVTDAIQLLNNNLIDGYDSRVGPYTMPPDYTNSYKHVKIGTTSIAASSIWLGSETRVTGDVLAGVGGDTYEIITNPSGAAITGPWYNLPEPWEFEPITITVPPGVPSSGSIGVGSAWDATGSIRIGTPGVTTYWRYDNIDVPNGDSLILLGDVELHITGDILLKNSAALYVGDPLSPAVPASAIIYLDGDLGVNSGAAINNLSEIPARFWLWGTGPPYQNWDIRNSGDYYGVYYGPNANIHTYAAAQFYGSVSGHEFVLNLGAGLHYDQDLADLHQYDTGFAIDRWWETVGP